MRSTSGTVLVVLLAGCLGVYATPIVPGERLESPPSNFIGEGTNELATTLLQGFVGEETDFVFSPLGYSVILAMMAEGARGETHKQLVSALPLPEDTYAVRDNYRQILQSMKDKWSLNHPEFKNWFYVYKNYTVDDKYKQVLLEYYLTEVKQVDRVHYEVDFETEEENEPEEIKVEDTNSEGKVTTEPTENTENPKQSETEGRVETGKETEEKEDSPFASKFDGSKDIASALTANPLMGRDSEGTELNTETRMIVFNGLYFRGNWQTPFKASKGEKMQTFYKTKDDKKMVSTMKTSGTFNIGNVTPLDAVALELPYEGEQYSMLILLPNQRDGLTKLTEDITGFSLNRVYKHLEERPTEVCLPKFQVQTISHPEKILQQYGIKDLFTKDADLSGISSDQLRMGALVQLVNIQVDEGSADTNFLTTTNVGEFGELRNNAEKFVADHPFLFFIRDHTKNIIIAAGKVLDPKYETSDVLAP